MTDSPSNQRHLGMVFQNYALFPHMTIFETSRSRCAYVASGRRRFAGKVAEALELVRLPDVGPRRPRELSGGQQQRIAIARCLVYNPNLILMDEPLGALDKKLRDQMQLEIKRLHTSLGVTILYVTHDQEEALVMSDRICLMNRGRVEAAGGAPTNSCFGHERCSLPTSSATRTSSMRSCRATNCERSGELVSGQPRRDFLACRGRARKIMIRPESLRVLDGGEGAPCYRRRDPRGRHLRRGAHEVSRSGGGAGCARRDTADGRERCRERDRDAGEAWWSPR